MWILEILARNLIMVFITELLPGFFMGAKTSKKLTTVALVNIITNPPVVLCSMCLKLFFPKWYFFGVFILELLAVFTEGFIFSRFETFGKKNPYFISFVLNLISFVSGEIINIFL